MFKVGVIVPGEREPSFNGLRFKTEEEANAYGSDLLSRWLLPTSFVVLHVCGNCGHEFDSHIPKYEEGTTNRVENPSPCSECNCYTFGEDW